MFNCFKSLRKKTAGKNTRQADPTDRDVISVDATGSNQVDKSHSRSKLPSHHRHDSPSSYSPSNFRSEASFKNPNPQKNKAMDKNPRARESSTPKPRNTFLAEYDHPEFGPFQAPFGRKQNINDLFQFIFTPREPYPPKYKTFGIRHYAGGPFRKYNKDQFLQSHCQFMVNKDADCSLYKTDPDVLVDWNLIELIRLRVTGEQPNCPICMSPPVAAKLTKCGHIYCCSCLLHYFALSDRKCRPCPMCFESIEKEDMKSVVVKSCKEVAVGGELEMQLICRPKNSLEAEKYGGEAEKALEGFSKVISISSHQVVDLVIRRELTELQEQLEEQKDLPEVCFVHEAIIGAILRRGDITGRKQKSTNELVTEESNGYENKIENAEMLLLEGIFSPGAKQKATNKSATQEANGSKTVNAETASLDGIVSPGANKQKATNESGAQEASGTESKIVKAETSLLDGKESGRPKSRNDSVGSSGEDNSFSHDKNFYYYQASDGQNVFLHPLNMSMLRKEFGPDPSIWPALIKFTVLEVENETVTDEIRKRYKFLSHLPLTSPLQFVELDFKPPFISEMVGSSFRSQLEHRKKRRADRQEDEKRLEKIQAEATKKKNWMPRPEIESKTDFPKWGVKHDYTEEDEIRDLNEAIQASMADNYLARDVGDVPLSGSAGSSGACRREVPPFLQASMKSLSVDHNYPGLSQQEPASASSSHMSFAQAASSGSGSGFTWKRSPTFPIPSTRMASGVGKQSTSHVDDLDDEYSAPEYRTSVSNAIALAFESMNGTTFNEQENSTEMTGSGGQKKKGRKKGKVLFATGVGLRK